jgi:hypothetical protein
VKNFILKSITFIAAVALIIGTSLLDSESNAPAYVVIAAMAWTTIFCLVNQKTIKQKCKRIT